uniref:PHD-type domain-containing protein n=1 Tax=Panagrolaimus sp. JU765 TaxID=591449 RepID=A0AC34PVX2_9BILA
MSTNETKLQNLVLTAKDSDNVTREMRTSGLVNFANATNDASFLAGNWERPLPDTTTDPYVNVAYYDVRFDFNHVDYVHDKEDIIYVKKFNKRKETRLDIPLLELVIDRFEKMSMFELYRTGQTGIYAEKTVITSTNCEVCGLGEDWRNNKIVTCQFCHVAVHQECYGLGYLPINKWTCKRCGICPTMPIKCALCPHEWGAMKFTTDNRAVHQLCAVWSKAVSFGSTPSMEPIELNQQKLHRHKCDLCGLTYGGVVRCAGKKRKKQGSHHSHSDNEEECDEAYHLTCAILAQANLEVEVNFPGQRGKYIRKMYCMTHSGLPPYEQGKKKKEVEKSLEVDAQGQRPYPIDLRLRPISENYMQAKYFSNLLTDVDIEIIHDYWLMKRMRHFGHPMLNSLRVLFDRLIEPPRKMAYCKADIVSRGLRLRANLFVTNDCKISVVADYRKDDVHFETDDSIIGTIGNLEGHINFEDGTVAEMGIRLFADRVLTENIERKILYSTDPEELSAAIVQVVKDNVDPTVFTNFAEPDYAKAVITPWDIFGICFFAFCPEYLQVLAILNALKNLDEAKMFVHFNQKNPNHINFATMTRMALAKKYTVETLITDFHKMMKPAMSSFITGKRRNYVEVFEEAACYILPSKPFGKIVQFMVSNIDFGNRDHEKQKILLNHLLNELLECENVDPILKQIPRETKFLLQSVSKYIKHAIFAEKKIGMPNWEFVVDLFKRREPESDNDAFILQPNIGFPLMISERAFAVKSLMLKPTYKFNRVGWKTCFKMPVLKANELPVIDFGIRNNTINFEIEYFNKINLRKRRYGFGLDEPKEKKRRSRRKSHYTVPRPVRRPPPRQPSPKHRQIFTKAQIGMPDVLITKYVNETFVMVKNCSIGEHLAGIIIDPELARDNRDMCYIFTIRNANLRNHSCVKLFLDQDEYRTEWVHNSNISVANMVKLTEYINEHENDEEVDLSLRSIRAMANCYWQRKTRSQT